MSDRSRLRETLRRCLQVIAAVAMVHVLVVAVLLFLQGHRLAGLSPLETKELQVMQEQLKRHPEDEALRERLRTYDLVVRRVWFEGQSWRRDGLKLLVGGLLVAFGALLAAGALRGRRVRPLAEGLPPPPDPMGETRAVAAMAGLSLLTALVVLMVLPHAPRDEQIAAAGSGDGAGPGRVAAVGSGDGAGPGRVAAVGAAAAAGQGQAPATGEARADGGRSPAGSEPPRPFTDAERQVNWPNFRGLRGTGRALDRRAVTGWDVATGKGIRWAVSVPLPGFSSPIVWEGLVFVTGGDGERRALFAFDADTGALRWDADTTAIPGSPARLPEVTGDTGFAASTPATDGRRVHAIFATGNLISCDMTGRRLWARALGVPSLNYGHASSLLAAGERLVVQVDGDEEQRLFCLDGATGTTLWERRRDTKTSWSSPAHVRLDERDLVVVATSRHVEAFELSTGEPLWSVATLRGEMAPSPTFDGKTVYVAGDSAYAAAIDAATGKLLWKNGSAVLPDVSSPVVLGGELYLFASGGTLSCLETAGGEILWETDLPTGWYGSPLALDGAVLAFDRKGGMMVLRPGTGKLDVLAEGQLGEAVDTTPALVGNRMFVRGRERLFCLEGGSR